MNQVYLTFLEISGMQRFISISVYKQLFVSLAQI